MLDPKQAFRGVFGFPITPFQKDLSLDLPALEKNCDWMAGYDFCAQVVVGGTGEIYSLTPEEAIECVRVSVKLPCRWRAVGKAVRRTSPRRQRVAW